VTETQRPASADTSETVRPLSSRMKRFLSVVEHELDAEDTEEPLEEDEELRRNDDRPRQLPSTAIVALEVRTTHDDRGTNYLQTCGLFTKTFYHNKIILT